MDYLSDAWIAAANGALSASDAFKTAKKLVIAQHVADARTYVITLGESGASLAAVADLVDVRGVELPDDALVFRQSWSTACNIARGDTDAHQAFLLGEVHFSGDIATLLASTPALSDLASALAPVMAQTTFPETFTAG